MARNRSGFVGKTEVLGAVCASVCLVVVATARSQAKFELRLPLKGWS
jgi:hypothetical protein